MASATAATASAAKATAPRTAIAVLTPPTVFTARSAASVSFCRASARSPSFTSNPTISRKTFSHSKLPGMGKAPPPLWSRRDCRFDHLVAAAVDRGFGIVMSYAGIETVDRAHDIRRGIYRCARHRKISAEAGRVSLAADDDEMGIHRQSDGTYTLRYRVWSKASARKSHLARNGTDRSAWAYDPKRKATAAERETWANRNELNQPVYHE